MKKIKGHIGIVIAGSMAFIFLILSGCGGFGGRYKIEKTAADTIPASGKFAVNVRIVLKPELCGYTYVSKRQGAKRVYELGDALCTSTRNLFTAQFTNVMVVSNDDEGKDADFDATVIPQVVDTSVLVRPGFPPNFEATIIYECSMVDKNNRTIFLRTINEDKVYEGYGHKGYGIVMQQAVDELFNRLGSEVALSPEIKRFAGSIKGTELRLPIRQGDGNLRAPMQ
ncbi:MAG TPA: hypothetical protein ENO00_03615 [Deltaproteobacteria bacterium]|nr:hypothetical protein [Deltaproteobacteria bacterium]